MSNLYWPILPAMMGALLLASPRAIPADSAAPDAESLACEPDAQSTYYPSLLLDEAANLAVSGKLERKHKLHLVDRAEFHSTESAQSVRAEFLLDDLHAVILSERATSGGMAYSIRIGAKTFEGKLSLPEFNYRLDGNGNSVNAKEKIFLIALAWRLESEGWDESRAEKNFVYRLANMLSEIPVGYEFNVIEFNVQEAERQALLNILNSTQIGQPRN